jgi:hypothetical protein
VILIFLSSTILILWTRIPYSTEGLKRYWNSVIMSQSPLARSTRKSLPAFAHPPSRLSKSTSIQNLSQSPSPVPTPNSTPNSTPTNKPSYKNASTTPTTPKILYSPYATSSPHAGPSRSASIPFDMAASARDARRKSLGPVHREETPEVDEIVTVTKKRKGIMRKKPILTRCVS